MKTETVKDNEKVKVGLGHCHPGQSHALLVKGWWKSRSACWNCLKMREGAEVCPWLSLEAQSPSERILKYLPLMWQVLKAGSSVLSASPSSCHLSQEWALSGEGALPGCLSHTEGPTGASLGQEAAHTFEAWTPPGKGSLLFSVEVFWNQSCLC